MFEVTHEMLNYVATEMFESTAFMFLEPGEGAIEEDDVVRAEISFSHQGERARLVIAATAPFSAELAANFLGLEEDDDEVLEAMDGAVGEMANIIAGFLTAQVFGSAVIELTPPSTKRVSASDLAAEAASAQHQALLASDEGGLVSILAFTMSP